MKISITLEDIDFDFMVLLEFHCRDRWNPGLSVATVFNDRPESGNANNRGDTQSWK